MQVQVEPIARRAVEALFFCHVPALGQIYNGPICLFLFFICFDLPVYHLSNRDFTNKITKFKHIRPPKDCNLHCLTTVHAQHL